MRQPPIPEHQPITGEIKPVLHPPRRAVIPVMVSTNENLPPWPVTQIRWKLADEHISKMNQCVFIP